jgi:hypothetical protein
MTKKELIDWITAQPTTLAVAEAQPSNLLFSHTSTTQFDGRTKKYRIPVLQQKGSVVDEGSYDVVVRDEGTPEEAAYFFGAAPAEPLKDVSAEPVDLSKDLAGSVLVAKP